MTARAKHFYDDTTLNLKDQHNKSVYELIKTIQDVSYDDKIAKYFEKGSDINAKHEANL
jgi:hypothetical protein